MNDENTRFLSEIGKRIKELRKIRNFTQIQLAEIANLHYTYISDIERGSVNASITTFESIARALEIPLSKLFYFSSERSSGDDFQVKFIALMNSFDEKDIEFKKTVLKIMKNLNELK